MPHIDRAHAHEGAFTAVFCCDDACRPEYVTGLLAALRATTQRCPHGVLITSACVLGRLGCRSHPHVSTGTRVLVQPCWPDRRPRGGVVCVGPVRSRADTWALCRWLERGELGSTELPERLRHAVRSAQHAAAN